MKNTMKIMSILFIIIAVMFSLSLTGCAKKEEPVKVTTQASAPAATPAPAVAIPVFDTVYFGFNKYGPKKASIETINNASEWMKKNATFKITISGHADAQGNAIYNKNLSKMRADYVKKLMIKNGVSEDRIQIEFFGQDKPVSKKFPENRRVEFKVLK
jgi:outer membrane protein OmpA-like peptidoglycan-associated protein